MTSFVFWKFTEVYSYGFKVRIGSGNALALHRQQDITWTNDYPVGQHIHVTGPQWVNGVWPEEPLSPPCPTRIFTKIYRGKNPWVHGTKRSVISMQQGNYRYELRSSCSKITEAWNETCHLVAIAETVIQAPCHSAKSLQLIWNQAAVDEIYSCPIFKCVAVTWLKRQGTRIIVPAMATRVICPINGSLCHSVKDGQLWPGSDIYIMKTKISNESNTYSVSCCEWASMYKCVPFDTLWPSETLSHQRSWSTLL